MLALRPRAVKAAALSTHLIALLNLTTNGISCDSIDLPLDMARGYA